jgi:hypothetical protein
MNRRNLFERLGIVILGLTAIPFSKIVSAKDKTASSQSEAIALVIDKQQKEIAQAETNYFKENGVDWWRGEIEQYHWHDTISRTWTAIRTFAPGIIDSTHSFIVTYAINNKPVCYWTVDTEKNKVSASKSTVI